MNLRKKRTKTYGGPCMICGGNNESYMVRKSLWRIVIEHPKTGLVCIKCFQNKLGRKLKHSDFSSASINEWIFGRKIRGAK